MKQHKIKDYMSLILYVFKKFVLNVLINKKKTVLYAIKLFLKQIMNFVIGFSYKNISLL